MKKILFQDLLGTLKSCSKMEAILLKSDCLEQKQYTTKNITLFEKLFECIHCFFEALKYF